LFFAIYLICDYHTAGEGYYIFIAIVFCLLSIITCVIGLVVKSCRFLIDYSLLVLVAFASAGALFYLQSNERMMEKDQLQAAIYHYKRTYNLFPKTLQQLSPRFLKKVPVNNFGFRSKPYLYSSDVEQASLQIQIGGNKVIQMVDDTGWDYQD